ncbi:hypothetical protein GIB67_028726 [Kingdonia uniflora]|uniref:Uncharacterized protein n=1 Tax=Kingdonia uniflora TaxID=39325 RepID=A0A7J7NAK4_9MAGN|nr:hypothetical protein GIB67_028726 [Kingdonia uniflora]
MSQIIKKPSGLGLVKRGDPFSHHKLTALFYEASAPQDRKLEGLVQKAIQELWMLNPSMMIFDASEVSRNVDLGDETTTMMCKFVVRASDASIIKEMESDLQGWLEYISDGDVEYMPEGEVKFVVAYIKLLESTPKNRAALLMALVNVNGIYSSVNLIMQVYMDYWNCLVTELFQASHSIGRLQMPLLSGTVDGLGSQIVNRQQLYSTPMSKLRMLMISFGLQLFFNIVVKVVTM